MTDNNHTAVADFLTSFFRSGIRINDDILAFARTVLNATTQDELKSLVMDEDDYGRGIIDLLFSPDDATRFKIEQVIPPAGIALEYHKDIITHVTARIDTVEIYLSAKEVCLRKNISERMICGFVRKLHLEKNLDYPEMPDLQDPERRDMLVRARALLRSRVYTSTPRREQFFGILLSSLMGRHEIGESCVRDCIDLILRIFMGISEDSDVESLLSGKVQQSLSIMQSKKLFIEHSRTGSMEYLMSQKFYDPPESMNSLMRDIALADIINYLVFVSPKEGSAAVHTDGGSMALEGLDEKLERLVAIGS